jgi:hypothetical protein
MGPITIPQFAQMLAIFGVKKSQPPLNYISTWNANTNTPTLASGVGTANSFYIVSVAGTTTLDGISSWSVGDWAIFNGTVWEKVPYSSLSGALLIANGLNELFTAGNLSSALANLGMTGPVVSPVMGANQSYAAGNPLPTRINLTTVSTNCGVVMPDMSVIQAMESFSGCSCVVYNAGSIAQKVWAHDGTTVLQASILSGQAYEFFCLSNSSANGTWSVSRIVTPNDILQSVNSSLSTTNATLTTIATIPLSINQTALVTAKIVGKNEGSTNSAWAVIECTVSRQAGDIVFIGAPVINGNQSTTESIQANLNTGSESLLLQVQGVVSETYNWLSNYTIQTITDS